VIFDCEKTGKTAVELCDALREKDIWALDTEKYSVRFVTHCDVDGAGVQRALAALGQIVAQPQRARA
jgi:threonine aldolase